MVAGMGIGTRSGAGLGTHSVPREPVARAPEGAASLLRAPHALPTGDGSDRREAAGPTLPRSLAPHAFLCRHLVGGAVSVSGYLHHRDVGGFARPSHLLALQRQPEANASRPRTGIMAGDHRAMGERNWHTVRSGCCIVRAGNRRTIRQEITFVFSVPVAVQRVPPPVRFGTAKTNSLESIENFSISYTPAAGLMWSLPFEE